MRKKMRAAHAAAWLLGGATIAVSGRASADACTTLANPVYVSGSSAFKPVLQAVANVLGSAVNIVYQSPGSCEGLSYLVKATPDTDTPTLIVPNAANGTCTLPLTGSTVDIALSDVYPKTCTSYYDNTIPAPSATQNDFLGPVQAMTFAVPTDSSENIISAEAAYMVFGFAAAAGKTITPWVDPAQIFVRYFDSGTLEMIATAINLPGSKWVNATNKGSAQTVGGTGPMQTALTTAESVMANQSTAIGILSTSGLKTGIKGLAFQGVGQSCSYYPDSGMGQSDKINVRQGRYEIWGPEHMVTNVDNTGKPVGLNSNTVAVQTLINALLSTSQALPVASDAGAPDGGVTTLGETEVGQIISAISVPSVGFITRCAMQVSRIAEIGAEASYAPPAACSCAFELAAGSSPGSTCSQRMCTTSADCTATPATPTCHFKFCEAE
jgi:ABC-type phosphate transport system substrate-binding protein